VIPRGYSIFRKPDWEPQPVWRISEDEGRYYVEQEYRRKYRKYFLFPVQEECWRFVLHEAYLGLGVRLLFTTREKAEKKMEELAKNWR
jgi:hypothetical protein